MMYIRSNNEIDKRINVSKIANNISTQLISLLHTVGQVKGSSRAKNQPDLFSRFDRTPTCERQTQRDRHRAIASTHVRSTLVVVVKLHCYSYRCSMLCLLIMTMSCVEMAQLIEILTRLWTLLGSDLPAVDIVNLIHQGAGPILPLATGLLYLLVMYVTLRVSLKEANDELLRISRGI